MSWTLEEIAERLARDISPGTYVNLGIGMPTMVSRYVPLKDEVMRHSENGIIGTGGPPRTGEEDPDLIDPGKNPTTLVLGAAICDHVVSFTIIRGGHLDIAVMGAMQVSEHGDLANWKIRGQRMGSVGGAMDLAVGAKQVWVIMQHRDREGASKVVHECTFPLTAKRCVTRVYTDLAVLAIESYGLDVIELAPGVSRYDLEAATEAHLHFG